MTPDELRSLADAPTEQVRFVGHPDFMEINTILSALAPDLARLCAEYAGAFAQIEKLHHKDFDLAPQIAQRALAKLSELKT